MRRLPSAPAGAALQPAQDPAPLKSDSSGGIGPCDLAPFGSGKAAADLPFNGVNALSSTPTGPGLVLSHRL